jgi:hypothetical protein
LGLLQGEVALLLSAAVKLERVLVGVDVYLNSRPQEDRVATGPSVRQSYWPSWPRLTV